MRMGSLQYVDNVPPRKSLVRPPNEEVLSLVKILLSLEPGRILCWPLSDEEKTMGWRDRKRLADRRRKTLQRAARRAGVDMRLTSRENNVYFRRVDGRKGE